MQRSLKATLAALIAVWTASSAIAGDAPDSALSRELGNAPILRWHVAVLPTQARPGDDVEVVFTADIASGWILYSSDFNLEMGPRPTRFTFDANPSLTFIGPVQAVRPEWKTDRTLGAKYSYFDGRAEFRQKARLVAALNAVTGRIDGQTCAEKSGLCELFHERFSTAP